MATRIPMRIYRLKQTPKKDSVFGLGVTPLISPWNYLLGLNEDNIQFYGSTTGKSPTITNSLAVGIINLTAGNLPNPTTEDLTKPYTVYKEIISYGTVERYYVNVGNRKYYILRTQLATSDPNEVPEIFEFYINPQHFTPNYKKLITEIRTRGGYEIQHWGDALTELRITGVTGGLQRDISKTPNPGQRSVQVGLTGANEVVAQTLSSTQPITESTAWKRLTQLRRLYTTDHELANTKDYYKIGFNYYDKFYVGYFVDFQGPEADAMKPYLMNFSFTIKVEQETILSTSQIAVTSGVNLT